MTFLHSVALKQLQQFLDVPSAHLLERNRTQPLYRELRIYVYHIVNDITSPEGKACTKFMVNLRHNGIEAGKNLLEEIGNIVDAVQEYMLENRFEEMRVHLERLVAFFSSSPAMEQVQVGRKNSLVNLSSMDIFNNHEKVQQLISDAIRYEMEEKICVPLMPDLNTYLRTLVTHKEQQFRQRVFQLKGKPQSYFGIPIDKISLSSWRSVVDAIKEMDDAFLPLDKMRKLVHAAHMIHSLYNIERQIYRTSASGQQRRHSIATPVSQDTISTDPNTPASPEDHSLKRHKSEQEDLLNGDDILPIFIYVIVHSELEAPIMTQVLLNRLSDPEKRRSETGYYLATYEAALHHILSREILTDES